MTAAERTACGLAVADAPGPGPDGHLVVAPALVGALGRSGPVLRSSAVRHDYLDVLDVCHSLGLARTG